LSLINDVLDLSKVEAGRMEIEMIPCAVHKVVKDVIEVMLVKANQKNIFLRFEPDGPLPSQVVSDPAKLRQILTNLVGNAIKFTEQGGITVVTRVQTTGKESVLVMDVVDTGIGMTPKQADSVFEAFAQADTSTTRKYGGTGLGLSISKSFAQGLGGDIVLSSEAGKGSTFSTTISLGELPSDVEWLDRESLLAEEEVAETTTDVSWVFPSAHVLVVDDAVENRELLQLVLEDYGLQVSIAVNGAEALEMALARSFDYILMDVQMPVMDGATAVGLMRERGLTLPVVALTAEAMQGTEQKCLDAGFSGYKSKPVDIDQLMALLAADLGAEAGSRQAQTSAGVTVEQGGASATEIDPVVSSLPADNAGYRRIIEKFILRLEQQLLAMRSAWQDQDLEELSRLAHWLKGSGGSVGFHAFTEPARELEEMAKTGQVDRVAEVLATLENLHSRIGVGEAEPAPQTPIALETPAERAFDIPEVIESSLDDGKPQFRSILGKFVGRLAEQTTAMDNALRSENLEELARLAHWLKGSAGTLGFNLFTQPAMDLENYAKAGQLAAARGCMDIINEMNRRIVVPQQHIVEAEG
jgi:CheY-like chemotaxis protein